MWGNMTTNTFTLNPFATGFTLDPSHPDSGLVGMNLNELPVWTAYQTAAHLARPGNSWADYAPGLVVTYSFGVGVTLPAGYEAFASVQAQEGARRAMTQYADVSGLTFVESADPAVANITFMFGIGSTNGGGWANYPSNSGFVQVGHVPWEPEMVAGSYSLNLILHELGHGVGLAHPGEYNGDSAVYADADHFNDSGQYTNMSYWGESLTGADFSDLATLGLHDILATQMEYGINWATRSNDTVYGFNATAGNAAFDFGFDKTMGFSIWDGGGNDLLDFSGFGSNTVMDLRQGSFSSTGLETYNVSIAYGALIENATGGGGGDRIMGNAFSNLLQGGSGNDVIFGGSEMPMANIADPRNFTGIQLNEAPNVRNQYASIAGVTAFSGSAFTVETMVKLTRIPGSAVEFASYNVTGNDNQLIFGGQSNGNLTLTIANKAEYVTDYSVTRLVDGNPHRLSLTWDKTSGTVNVYVDGVIVHAGVYTAAIGANIASGGILVLGQEQDSLGGGFDTKQVYQGVMGDIRIFNDVRTGQEIDQAAFLSLTGSEQGLVHNWQVNAADTATVRDVAVENPSVDLTSLMPAGTFTANQSSIYSATTGASLILDNNDTTYNHTLNSGNEWVSLSFNQSLSIDMVQIINRPGQGARLNGATVSVLDANGTVIYTSAPISGATSGGTINISLPEAMLASAVRINHTSNYINIAELNVFGDAPAGTLVADALVNTDLKLYNGATAVTTESVIAYADDADTLVGGSGRDALYGGAGNDIIYGDLQVGKPAPGGRINMIHLNSQFDAATMGGGLADHALDQTQSFALPTTQFTFEMMVQLDAVPGWFDTLIGYSTGGEWDEQSFALRGKGSNWALSIADQTVTTNVALSSFVTDEAFRLSITWDKATGEYGLYRNGLKIDSGTVAKDAVLPATGNIYLASGWDATIKGSLGDIRVWNAVRSEAELQANAFVEVANPTTELGLVANWKVGTTGTLLNATTQPGVAALVVQNVKTDNPLEFSTADFTTNNADQLNGGAGSDTLVGGAGADTLNGDGDVDTASYVGSSAGVTVNLNLAGAQISSGDASGDILSGIESVTGSGLADNLTGTSAANVLSGDAGNDILDAGAGTDIVDGGVGNDWIEARTGIDTFNGGADTDTLSYYYSATAVNVALADAGAAVVSGEAAGDTITNIENLYGSNAGGDNLKGNSGANYITGMAGNDLVDGGAGNDWVIGGDGSDWLEAGTGTDTFDGGNGTDTLSYYSSVGAVNVKLMDSGNAIVSGGEAAGDIITNVEYLYGSNTGGDTLTGNSAANYITGMAGNDLLDGAAGNDVLVGGDGSDWLEAGTGTDTFDGSGGTDTLSYYFSALGVNINLATGAASGGEAAGDTITNVEYLYGSSTGGDILTGNAATNYFVGNGGADTLNGGLGNDWMVGGDGADTFRFDTALGAANVDQITDFNVIDTIQLENSVFTGFAVGAIAAANLSLTGAAVGTAAQVIYTSTTGTLAYDADGTGAAASTTFANIGAGKTLTVSDFDVT
jgi:Ca2+-binding RTX toxin-like protein